MITYSQVEYWTDKYQNKWDKTKFSEKEAEYLSKTLIDCQDCINSSFCYNCHTCIEITNCQYCVRCNNCHESNDCQFCYKCLNCHYCIRCINCEKCIRCYHLINISNMSAYEHITENDFKCPKYIFNDCDDGSLLENCKNCIYREYF